MPSKATDYSELFKKSEVIDEIRKQYTQYMNAKFPTSILLEPYQNLAKNKAFDAQKISAAEAIQRAYPPLKYDKQGLPVDNREQAFIDTVNMFTQKIAEKDQFSIREERELNAATKVYAALSSVETQKNRLKIKLTDINDNLKGEDRTQAAQHELNSFSNYCQELTDALKDHQPILKRGERSVSTFGNWINKIEDFIHDIAKRFLPKPERPTSFLPGHSLLHNKKIMQPSLIQDKAHDLKPKNK